METINDTKVSRKITSSLLDDMARKKVHALLKQLPQGSLTLSEQGEVYQFGCADSQPKAHMYIHHPSVYREIALGGSIGAAESYILSGWSSPDLTKVVQLMALNIDFMNQVDDSRFIGKKLIQKLLHRYNRNTTSKAKLNIAAHYDLSNDFFGLFLDDTMMYSAAIFPDKAASLKQASVHKLERICQKLDLKPEDHLLEIGSGWGGLAIYAAKKYQCRVTTITLSEQQYNFASQWIENLGLSDQIEIRLQDYRELEGSYDKLVSIEMIEAVGQEYYKDYFNFCNRLLKDDGLMLLQAITIPDHRYQHARNSVDFIQRYIFPGGSLPSNEVVSRSVRQYTNMQMIDMREMGEDYALTLQHWSQSFHNNIDSVKQLGFDQSFIRMWEYYLSYCEGGFRERAIGAAQFLFAKPGWRQLKG